MNAKLAIIANGRERLLTEDASISVELCNPLFNSTEMFSYPVSLSIDGNRDLLKNVDDVNSSIRPISLEHTPMQILADGLPFASGPMVISDDERLDGTMNVSVDSAVQSFDSMIADLNCNDIPIPESDYPSLIIGEKISNVTVEIQYRKVVVMSVESSKEDKKITIVFPAETTSSTFEPQALGFSYPAKCVVGSKQMAVQKEVIAYRDGQQVIRPQIAEDYTNVTDAYGDNARGSALGGAKFCNARVCYKHYDKDSDGGTSDGVVTVDDGKGGAEDRGPYWVLDARRPQSGICFYVLYFLECLFKHLGVYYDISALSGIEDMRHLCFFTTKCSYRTEVLHCGSFYKDTDADVIAGTKTTKDAKTPYFSSEIGAKKVNNNSPYVSDALLPNMFTDINKWLSSRGCGGTLTLEPLEGVQLSDFTLRGKTYTVGKEVDAIAVYPGLYWAKATANISKMIADEGNFPAMSVSSLLESLENMFGVKFSYDYERNKVTAYLLRDVFCKRASTPLKFNAQVLSTVPVTEKITGVRVGYSAESDKKEQQLNVRNGVKDYDTSYDYIDYPNPATASADKTTVTDKHYSDIFRNPYHGDMKVYIDTTTGNAYRVKIDSDYTDVNSMKPALFEVGQFHCVEEGDCSSINEDFVVEMISDLTPMEFNDVNYQREKANIISLTDEDGNTYTSINSAENQPMLAAYIDEDMEHEFVTQLIRQNLAGDLVNAYFTEILSCVESYDPSSTDDGNSPLQHYDWGNAIAMMRGGGSDATYSQYASNYDGFNNNKWRMNVGLYALTSDSIDQYGALYDYNGVAAGGVGEHFSLKPRAYKQPSWAKTILCQQDQMEGGERIRIASRGYVDTFLIEYIYFLLHRHKYVVTCLTTPAQIADIPNHWKEWWNIDGKRCLINKVNTDISVKNGMGVVELEVYSL